MKRSIALILVIWSSISYAQMGGLQTFQFLNFNNSARVEATGGHVISVKDNDATLGLQNPALLNKSMHGFLALDYVNYFADSDFGFASYTKHNKLGTFSGSMLYANYGKFKYADVSGQLTGTNFSANDLALGLSYGRSLDSNFSVGATFRLAGSFYESYNAFGAGVDLGAFYQKKSRGLGVGLVVKNVGVQFKSYTSKNREAYPFNADLGISKKLAHAPFRLSFTYTNMQRFDLVAYDSAHATTKDPITGQTTTIQPPGFVKKLSYHFVLGGEILLSKNFHIRFGYNHQVRKDMAVAIRPGMAGFSWGLGFRVKKLQLSYGMGKTHIAGTSNHITITTNIGKPPKVDDMYRQKHFE